MKISTFVFLFLIILFNTVVVPPGNTPLNDQVFNSSIENISQNNSVMDTLLENKADEVIPGSIFNITETGQAYPGYNLFVLRKVDRVTLENSHDLLIINNNGSILFNESIGSFHSLDYLNTEFINSTHFMFGDPNGKIQIVNIETNEREYINNRGHHDIEYNYLNNTFFTLKFYTRTIGNESFVYDRIVELDHSGNEIWDFDLYPLIPPENEVYGDIYVSGNNTVQDVTHSNTVFFNDEDNTLIVNSRNGNTFFKINHTTSQVIWGLGEYGNFSLFDINGNPKSSLFYNAHAVEQIADNRFIIFDNDRHNRTDLASRTSRLVEIEVNETTMEARIVWEYKAPRTYYSAIWGDADRLPNGDRLGVFGTPTHPDTTMGARIVEVNNIGQIVWEMNFPFTSHNYYGVYRNERINFSPSVISPGNFTIPVGSQLDLKWNTYYNFRNKVDFAGSYQLYINGSVVESQTHVFPKYWQDAPIEYPFSTTTPGTYNMTLVVADEGGHKTIDTIWIDNRVFSIERIGNDVIELGSPHTSLVWTGFTTQELNYTIDIDNQLFTGKWNGENITLDLSQLENGKYDVIFKLLNGTDVLYVENFQVELFPFAAPIIETSVSSLSYEWHENKTISIHLFDHNPKKVELEIKDVYYDEFVWEESNLTLNFSIPQMDEGKYTLEIRAIDRVDQETVSIIEINVLPPQTPIIMNYQSLYTAYWGSQLEIKWLVHGAGIAEIKLNDTLIKTIDISDYILRIPIQWQQDRIGLGMYQLEVHILGQNTVIQPLILQILFDYGDRYADSVVYDHSENTATESNALGAPDGKFARITTGYSNGFLTLDLGAGETIYDGEGDDFRIYSKGGNYTIYTSNSLSTDFTRVDQFSENQSINLEDYSIKEVRYVWIEFFSGNDVLVDSIEVINLSTPHYEEEIPYIEPIEGRSYWSNYSIITLKFNAQSLTPWSFSVEVDGSLYNESYWLGGEIITQYIWDQIGKHDITITVTNLFGNSNQTSFTIEIVSDLLKTDNLIKIGVSAAIGIGLIIMFVFIYRRRLRV